MDDNKFTKEQENALKSDETSVTNEKMVKKVRKRLLSLKEY